MMNGATMASAQSVFQGSPGAMLVANGFDTRALRPYVQPGKVRRANDLLRKDEWIALDDVLIEVARRQLGAVQDLRNAGLVRNLGSIGVSFDEYEAVGTIDPAEQNMSAVASGQRDLAEFQLNTVPIPITFRDFQLHARALAASRRGNSAIDTTNVDLCASRVNEKLEETLFNGSNIQSGGNVLNGYTTASSRITGTIAVGWDTATGEQIVADVLAMIAAAETENYFGQFMFYVPVNYMQALRADFKANSDKTILMRLQEIDSFQGVRGTTSLTAEVVAVRLTRDVVDLSVAQSMTVLQWGEMAGLIQNFKVLSAEAPRIKIPKSSSAKTGLVHFSV